MSVLAQGLTPPDPIAVADTQLPPPRDKLDEVPSTSGPKHPFILPPNREGQAPILRPGRRPAAATTECPAGLYSATISVTFVTENYCVRL